MRDSKGHTHAIASSKMHINVLFLNFSTNTLHDIFECNYKRNNGHEKMNSFFNITAQKTLDVKFTASDFYFFTILVKSGRKKGKKIRKLGNKGISKMKNVKTRRTISILIQRKISKKFFDSY